MIDFGRDFGELGDKEIAETIGPFAIERYTDRGQKFAVFTFADDNSSIALREDDLGLRY